MIVTEKLGSNIGLFIKRMRALAISSVVVSCLCIAAWSLGLADMGWAVAATVILLMLCRCLKDATTDVSGDFRLSYYGAVAMSICVAIGSIVDNLFGFRLKGMSGDSLVMWMTRAVFTVIIATVFILGAVVFLYSFTVEYIRLYSKVDDSVTELRRMIPIIGFFRRSRMVERRLRPVKTKSGAAIIRITVISSITAIVFMAGARIFCAYMPAHVTLRQVQKSEAVGCGLYGGRRPVMSTGGEITDIGRILSGAYASEPIMLRADSAAITPVGEKKDPVITRPDAQYSYERLYGSGILQSLSWKIRDYEVRLGDGEKVTATYAALPIENLKEGIVLLPAALPKSGEEKVKIKALIALRDVHLVGTGDEMELYDDFMVTYTILLSVLNTIIYAALLLSLILDGGDWHRK